MRKIDFGKPLIGNEEISAVTKALQSPQLVHGPNAETFERNFEKFVGGGHAVSLSSCTAGLHLAYLQLQLGIGDEVIVPAQTHVATAHAVSYVGAKPVFVDVDKETGNIDVAKIEDAITDKTRAICVVHYLGCPVEMDKILKIAKNKNLFVVEDAALALGATYRGVHVGLLGDVGVFSFYPVKHITTAEGGMLLTLHERVAHTIKKLKAFGYDKQLGERSTPGLYDVNMLGLNYRMNEIQASLGIVQLKRINDFLQRRRQNSKAFYTFVEEISEIQLLGSKNPDIKHANYCCVAILKGALAGKRDVFIAELKLKGIGTSIYYPGPVPALTYYQQKYGYDKNEFPNASMISENSVAFSVGPHLNENDMEYTGEVIKKIIQKIRAGKLA